VKDQDETEQQLLAEMRQRITELETHLQRSEQALQASEESFQAIFDNAAVGISLVDSQGLRHLVPFILHHHERWDGGGYPDGLRGEQIPLEARILAVCDTVDAMASDRPYQQDVPPHEIIAELKRCAGTQFDPAVVQAFIRILEREGEYFHQFSPRGGAPSGSPSRWKELEWLDVPCRHER